MYYSTCIVYFQAEVLVNTVNEKLDFTQGMIARSFLEHAASEIDALKRDNPLGIRYGKCKSTGAGDLTERGVSTIIHCVLPVFDKWKFEQVS